MPLFPVSAPTSNLGVTAKIPTTSPFSDGAIQGVRQSHEIPAYTPSGITNQQFEQVRTESSFLDFLQQNGMRDAHERAESARTGTRRRTRTRRAELDVQPNNVIERNDAVARDREQAEGHANQPARSRMKRSTDIDNKCGLGSYLHCDAVTCRSGARWYWWFKGAQSQSEVYWAVWNCIDAELKKCEIEIKQGSSSNDNEYANFINKIKSEVKSNQGKVVCGEKYIAPNIAFPPGLQSAEQAVKGCEKIFTTQDYNDCPNQNVTHCGHWLDTVELSNITACNLIKEFDENQPSLNYGRPGNCTAPVVVKVEPSWFSQQSSNTQGLVGLGAGIISGLAMLGIVAANRVRAWYYPDQGTDPDDAEAGAADTNGANGMAGDVAAANSDDEDEVEPEPENEDDIVAMANVIAAELAAEPESADWWAPPVDEEDDVDVEILALIHSTSQGLPAGAAEIAVSLAPEGASSSTAMPSSGMLSTAIPSAEPALDMPSAESALDTPAAQGGAKKKKLAPYVRYTNPPPYSEFVKRTLDADTHRNVQIGQRNADINLAKARFDEGMAIERLAKAKRAQDMSPDEIRKLQQALAKAQQRIIEKQEHCDALKVSACADRDDELRLIEKEEDSRKFPLCTEQLYCNPPSYCEAMLSSTMEERISAQCAAGRKKIAEKKHWQDIDRANEMRATATKKLEEALKLLDLNDDEIPSIPTSTQTAINAHSEASKARITTDLTAALTPLINQQQELNIAVMQASIRGDLQRVVNREILQAIDSITDFPTETETSSQPVIEKLHQAVMEKMATDVSQKVTKLVERALAEQGQGQKLEKPSGKITSLLSPPSLLSPAMQQPLLEAVAKEVVTALHPLISTKLPPHLVNKLFKATMGQLTASMASMTVQANTMLPIEKLAVTSKIQPKAATQTNRKLAQTRPAEQVTEAASGEGSKDAVVKDATLKTPLSDADRPLTTSEKNILKLKKRAAFQQQQQQDREKYNQTQEQQQLRKEIVECAGILALQREIEPEPEPVELEAVESEAAVTEASVNGKNNEMATRPRLRFSQNSRVPRRQPAPNGSALRFSPALVSSAELPTRSDETDGLLPSTELVVETESEPQPESAQPRAQPSRLPRFLHRDRPT